MGHDGVDHRVDLGDDVRGDACRGTETAGDGVGGVRPGPGGAARGQFRHHLVRDPDGLVSVTRQPVPGPVDHVSEPAVRAESRRVGFGLPAAHQRVVRQPLVRLRRAGDVRGPLVLHGPLAGREPAAELDLPLGHQPGGLLLDLAAPG